MIFKTRKGIWLGAWLAIAAASSAIPSDAAAQAARQNTVGVEDPLLVEAQSVLRLLGHYTGRLDGQAGPRTNQAITEFQRANNLQQTGRLDDRTLGLLRQLRDTRLSGQLGSPNSGPQPAPMSSAPPAAIAAQPVQRVEAAPIAPAGPPGKSGTAPPDFTGAGTRPPLGSPTAPSLFSIPPASQPTPTTPTLPPPPPVVAAKAAGPFGLTSWDWLIPFAGVPLFIVLWRIATRKTRPEPLLSDGPRREPSVVPGGQPMSGGFAAPPSDRASRAPIQPRLRRTLGRRTS
ncbi:MAG: peptidoglycan-binding domain-containing protein [Elsteraceae bacterium]